MTIIDQNLDSIAVICNKKKVRVKNLAFFYLIESSTLVWYLYCGTVPFTS